MDPTTQRIMMTAGAADVPGGENIYFAQSLLDQTTRNYNWTCPAGVTSVSVVCIGGGGEGGDYGPSPGTGGGGGAALRYKNNISVTPGATYSVQVGVSRNNQSASSSKFMYGGTTLCEADGGSRGQNNISGPGGPGGSSGTGDGGGNGGPGGRGNNGGGGGGGGGAGGYSGNGGSGGTLTSYQPPPNNFNYPGAAPAGGGGSGGASGWGNYGGSGGGVYPYGQGPPGGATSSSDKNGRVGSFDSNTYGPVLVGHSSVSRQFGAGGRGAVWGNGDVGGSGCVRIIWPGTTRQFPSTNTEYQT